MANRSCALSRPWFFAAVAVLAVNDHVWKADHPGWVTGKISDVAGVAVVAALLSVLIGSGRATVVTAIGFVALKTVPGVAELAAPVMGGVTRRDPADLLALAVLPFVWRSLDREAAARAWSAFGRNGRGGVRRRAKTASPPKLAAPAQPGAVPTGRGRSGRVIASLIPVVGAVSALFVTTATSCASKPTVIDLVQQDTSVFARIDEGYSGDTWARSNDGGMTWQAAQAPPGFESEEEPAGSGTSAPATSQPSTSTVPGSTTASGSAGTPPHLASACGLGACYRTTGSRSIERSESGSKRWVVERRLDGDLFERSADSCIGPDGRLNAVALTGRRGEAVVSLGASGVLARNPDGSWEVHSVLEADRGVLPEPARRSVAFWATIGVIPVGMGAVWVLGRRASAARIVGLLGSPSESWAPSVSGCFSRSSATSTCSTVASTSSPPQRSSSLP